MKLFITSHPNGQIKHEEIELPERFLGLSIELDGGAIFQIDASDDTEESIEVREATFRKLGITPKSANSIQLKGII